MHKPPHPPRTMTATTEKTMTEEYRDDAPILAARRKKMERLIESGIDPWGHRFDGRQAIADIRSKSSEIYLETEAKQRVELPPEIGTEGFDVRAWMSQVGKGEFVGPAVRAAGRIVLHRDKGKLHFIDLQDSTGRIQLMIGKQQVSEDSWTVVECLDLGDILGVEGDLKRTRTGELTIFASQLFFLGKSLQPPPEKHHGLTDPELRQRMRYLDLTYTDGALQRFRQRSEIVRSIRTTLADQQFWEVEGPTLHSIAGGAAARPFTTHHNALDLDLFMRIALELHLKRLLVGGIERVFELGRVYRNEGISPKHNPEFTMLEVYEAYGNYETMMELTQKLIVDAIQRLELGYQLAWGDETIDYTPPFQRATYDELFEKHTGVAGQDSDGIISLAKKRHVETPNRHPDVIKNDVFELEVEPNLAGPIFVIDYPASICPLTKRKAGHPEIAERFELFVQGMEIANAYTELNDPDLQEKLFRTQLAGLSEEDSMAKMDNDFIRALRHGMPPAGGLGVGIDRLVMLLTNSQSIRDIILFPLLRPEAE